MVQGEASRSSFRHDFRTIVRQYPFFGLHLGPGVHLGSVGRYWSQRQSLLLNQSDLRLGEGAISSYVWAVALPGIYVTQIR